MKAIFSRLTAIGFVCMAIFGGGYWAGDHNRNNAWLAKQAKVEADAQKQYQAEVKRGEDAAGSYLADATTLRDGFTDLKEKFDGLRKRAPLVVLAAPGTDSVCSGAVAPGSDAAQGQHGSPAVNDILLTASAIWMWNSSLTGTDQPAGACSAADTSEASCSVATSITIDDAWANHTRNAQACAENRLAHQRLIDFIKTKDAKP